uniref:Prolyl 4-hydroxylase alpha subunit domain-containing protein n=1 Tax=Aplanochytrium stocchinoi TaxID=215587 RepID=A0A7S3LHP1_9STRA|mmetsp:Transcript_5710/g.6762  ORF Transcript_5710/g.6762 Transcript_5710/m.6762 type:complete len:251 (+) Transcript_5710:65-817(+)
MEPVESEKHENATSDSESFKIWLQNIQAIKKWASKYDIEKLLKENGDFVMVDKFLPDFVANGALETLESIPECDWEKSDNASDEYNDVSHSFWSIDSFSCVHDLVRVFMLLLPTKISTISAGKYTRAGHIVAHDDKDIVPVGMADDEVVWHSRDIAVVYYLTKNWKESYGGQFVDLKTGSKYTPKFNSAVFFRVPRIHEVTPVTVNRPRLSFFGWYLVEGIKYDPEAPNGLTHKPIRRSPRLLKKSKHEN